MPVRPVLYSDTKRMQNTAKVPAETGSAGENAADCGFQCGEAGEVLSDVNVVIDDEASHNCTKLIKIIQT